ncbi:MAG: type II secretion system protein, partial [Planctomycetota bacterium]
MRRQRGFTLIELLTVMAIISLLIGLLLPALAQARAKAQLTKDTAQVKQIHQSWVSFAREFDGAFPTPGLINRCPDPLMDNQDVPGRGPEDLGVNNSAFMYSACIMQNFFSPQLTVSPTEPSGYVLVKDDFDWSIYSPVNDIYWDAEFAVKLDALCNTSYS